MITYVLDLGSDFWVAYFHYVRAVEAGQAKDPTNPARLHWCWFGLTLLFIFVPSFVMSAFSLRWYFADYAQACRQGAGEQPTRKRRWFLRSILMVFQIGPVMRYIDGILYGLKSRWYKRKMESVEKKAKLWKEKTNEESTGHTPEVLAQICKYECKSKHFYDLMLYEDADAAMLRLFECFMESAPQTILQIYILSLKFFACPNEPNESHALSRCKDNIHIDESDKLDVATTAEMVSIALSVVSIAWGLVAYHKALRFSRSDKLNITHLSCVSMFLWRFFLLFPRLLLIALFASVFPAWHLAVFVGGHFLIILVWIMLQPSRFCSSAIEERVFRFFAAVIHVFVFFNLLEGRTRFRIATYYTVIFIEHVVVVSLWMCFAAEHHSLSTKLSLIAVVFGCFALGILFMILHYAKLHPNAKNIPIFLPREQIPCGRNKSNECARKPSCHCQRQGIASSHGTCCQTANEGAEVCCRSQASVYTASGIKEQSVTLQNVA